MSAGEFNDIKTGRIPFVLGVANSRRGENVCQQWKGGGRGGDHGENSHVFSIAAYKCKYCICVSKYVLLRDLLLICLLFTENV